MTERLVRHREQLGVNFTIVGVGGVEDFAGYERYRQAGADAVMSATGAMWNPKLAQQIKEQAREL
jgi:dihydroorotate dehydrogenase (NAD+) catalytic subunit